MDAQRKDALEWFVQFANMNLTELRPGDKAKLIVESEEYLFPINEMKRGDLQKVYDLKKAAADYLTKQKTTETKQNQFGFFKFLLAEKEDEKKMLGELISDRAIKSFHNYMSWAFAEPVERDSPQYWDKISRLQEVVKGIFSKNTSDIPGSLGLPVKNEIWVGEAMGIADWSSEKFRWSFLPLTQNHSGYIRLKLFRLLDGLPCSIIQKCPGCEKYFLNTTLRKKRFCSTRCMWRVNAEKRRKELKEKHPGGYKAYLKKQKEIMRRKYVEKRKAQLGPNVKVGGKGK